MRAGLQRPLAAGIGFQHTFGLILSPGLEPHFPDQTEIEDLGVMPQFGLIKIRLQEVAREVRAVAAKENAPLGSTRINPAGHG